MKSLILWSAIFLFAASCSAQKNEVDMVLGNTWSFNSNTSVAIPGISSPLIFPSGRKSNLTYEAGFARQLFSFRPGRLSLELNAAGFPASLNGNPAAVFVVPGAKFDFLPRSRVSPFASAGVGFARLSLSPSSTNAAAFQFGGGVDVKSPIRFLNLRAEVRDFQATDSGFANSISNSFPGVTAKGSSRNHLSVGGGAVLRF